MIYNAVRVYRDAPFPSFPSPITTLLLASLGPCCTFYPASSASLPSRLLGILEDRLQPVVQHQEDGNDDARQLQDGDLVP